jgi:hypothetical protein
MLRAQSLQLGWITFSDAHREKIDASRSGVTDAHCVALSARMKANEIQNLKKLDLVNNFFVLAFVFVLFLKLSFAC